MKKRQYGVQIVWNDPVKAGVREPEAEPRWLVFDTVEQADAFASLYKSTVGEKASAAGLPYEGPDKNDLWMDTDVAKVNRAQRWAVEVYDEWEPM